MSETSDPHVTVTLKLHPCLIADLRGVDHDDPYWKAKEKGAAFQLRRMVLTALVILEGQP